MAHTLPPLFPTSAVTNEQQEEYKFTRTTTTAQRRKLFKILYDGVNHINRMGQMVYGTDSANGLQFRSNWPSSSTRKSEAEENELLQ